MRSAKPLTRDQLYRSSDLSGVAFETTDDLPEFQETIGQDRAVQAIDFGLRMHGSGYNLYVLGPQGEQKRSLVLQHLESQAARALTR